MFHGGGDDDDENDFMPAPSTGSKLSSLFGQSSSKSSNLKYVAPKQPRSDSTGSSGEKNAATAAGQQPQGQPQAPAVLIATAVHAYLYVNDAAQSQGRAMCCLLGNVAEKTFQLLLYRSKQDHLTRARIHPQFTFTAMRNNYASFSDDQQRTWSINIDTGQFYEFVTQVGMCRAVCTLPGNQHLIQDVVVGEGPSLKEGDHAQISYSIWSVIDGKKGQEVEEAKSGHRIKLKEGAGSWETRLLGTQKNSRRLIFLPSVKDSTSVIFYDVTVERVKQKGSGDQSGRSTPQMDLQPHHKDISISNRSLNMLPEDTESNNENEGVPHNKAKLVSRMARMGHALLPSSVVNSRHPPTDSESEVEEVSRRRKHKYTSGSISGSVEELEATPAVRSRAPSSHSDSSKPEPAPRPLHLPQHPQQVVVYQSPWQQPAILPPGYTASQPGIQTIGVPPQVLAAPAPDPTMSLLFSETRSQNTELKISVSKMSDKIDGLSTKIEKLEDQLKQERTSAPQSSLVPTNSVMAPQFNYLPSSSAIDAQSILTQITTLVSDNEDMKARLEDREKKINSLNESVTLLLQKNQKLLEEKTDMLVAKQDAGTTVSITEVLALREEKAAVEAELKIAQNQLISVKEELVASKKLTEKQEEEINSLKVQAQEDQTKIVDLESLSATQMNKEVEQSQALKDAQLEKERLQNLLNTNESQKEKSADDITDLTFKKKELEEKLQATESERDTVKEKLRTTLQQMEERTSGDGESSAEKEENQLQEELKTKTSRIHQLEQELVESQGHCTEMKDDQSQKSSKYEAQIQKLESEKEALENLCNKMKNASANPEDVVGTVKKVMNTVFRTLKPQFLDDEDYSGATVMQTLLSVIRDTTLQLLEEVDEKKATEQTPPPDTENTTFSQEEARDMETAASTTAPFQ